MPKNSLISFYFGSTQVYFGKLHTFNYAIQFICVNLKLGMKKKHNTKQFILKFYIKIWKNTNNYLHI